MFLKAQRQRRGANGDLRPVVSESSSNTPRRFVRNATMWASLVYEHSPRTPTPEESSWGAMHSPGVSEVVEFLEGELRVVGYC
eukprot:2157353-Rhodomonas_salina.2